MKPLPWNFFRIFLVAFIGLWFFVSFLLPSLSHSGTWRYEMEPFYGVWGSSSDNVFMVGRRGAILHYNGHDYKSMDSGIAVFDKGTDFWLRGVWGSAADNVFAVGSAGKIIHYNGMFWNNMASGMDENLWAVWGSSESNVFAVGEAGTILHYNGTVWSLMVSGTTSNLYAIWGSGANNVYAAGESGTVLHFDGGTWNPLDLGLTGRISFIWGSDENNIYVGPSRYYDGSSWDSIEQEIAGITRIWGRSPTDLYVSTYAGNIHHYNGSEWTLEYSAWPREFTQFWGSPDGEVFAVGIYMDRGLIIAHYDGAGWKAIFDLYNKGLGTVWVASDDAVYALGPEVFVFNGRSWSQMAHDDSFYGLSNVLDVWECRQDSIFAVGLNGKILHYDGVEWSAMASGTTDDIFRGVWGSSCDDVFAVSMEGRIFHYNGTAWSLMVSGFQALYGIWGSSGDNVFAVGGDGILKYDGTAWSRVYPTDGSYSVLLRSVWGSSEHNIFAAGWIHHYPELWPGDTTEWRKLLILHFDGTSWSPIDLPINDSLPSRHEPESYCTGLWGRSESDVHAICRKYGKSNILHYDGYAWRTVGPIFEDVLLTDLSGDSKKGIFAVGVQPMPTILHYVPDAGPQNCPAVEGDEWSKLYSGPGYESANAFAQTWDCGLIVAGEISETNSVIPEDRDMWVLKLNAAGDVQWQKAYGGEGDDIATSVKQTRDGGYVVAGTTTSFGAGRRDIWVLKLDRDGLVQWSKTYGGSEDDVVRSIHETGEPDPGYVVGGATSSFGTLQSDLWVLKMDLDGNIQWQKTYGGDGLDRFGAMEPTRFSGFIVAGTIASFDHANGDFWVMKLDSEGDILWQKSYGGLEFDGVAAIKETRDGGYVVGGTTYSSDEGFSQSRVWVVKLDYAGNLEWNKTFATPRDDSLTSIEATREGHFILSGTSSRRYSFALTWLIEIDASGNILWQKNYGIDNTTHPLQDVINSVQQTQGGYIAVGGMESNSIGKRDLWVLKMEESGQINDCPIMAEWNAVAGEITAVVKNTRAVSVETSVSAADAPVVPADTGALELDACEGSLLFTIGLPKTGQTTTFLPGDDGALRRGVVWPEPRFQDNEDGTITDRLTGLIWLKDAACFEPDTWTAVLDTVADFNMNPAQYNCSQYNEGSSPYNDWRMPNFLELESLLHAEAPDPGQWLMTQGFVNVASDLYLTSTANHPYPERDKIVIHMTNGSANVLNTDQSYRKHPVWPVRGGAKWTPDPEFPANVWKTGQTNSYHPGDDGDLQMGVHWPKLRFTDNGDGTVTDHLTELMWLKDADCVKRSGYDPYNSWYGWITWTDAFDFVEGINQGTLDISSCASYSADYQDWRIPNRKELLSSLVNRSGLVLPELHPFWTKTYLGYYWTSTTSAASHHSGEYAFDVSVGGSGGYRANWKKSIVANIAWPVRSVRKDPIQKGDINGDGAVNHADTLLCLQTLAGLLLSDGSIEAGVEGDGRIGLPEAIYVLQWISDMRD